MILVVPLSDKKSGETRKIKHQKSNDVTCSSLWFEKITGELNRQNTKNPNDISLLSPWLDILLDRMQFLTPNAIQEEQKIAGSEQQCRDLKTSSGGLEIIFEILKTE